jgi:hypothetical protein
MRAQYNTTPLFVTVNCISTSANRASRLSVQKFSAVVGLAPACWDASATAAARCLGLLSSGCQSSFQAKESRPKTSRSELGLSPRSAEALRGARSDGRGGGILRSGVTQGSARSSLALGDSLSSLQGNSAYIPPSLQSRTILRQALGLGRSRSLWRGESRRGYLLFWRLTASGPHPFWLGDF